MSWLQNLAQVYDELYEKSIEGEGFLKGLSPMSTNSFKAHLEIVLSEKGELLRGKRVEKDDSPTLVPITVESINRTSTKIAPHPVFDQLGYIAGDLYKFYEEDSRYKEKHEQYIRQLKGWRDYDPNNRYVDIVYRYLNKGTLTSDLCEMGLLKMEGQGYIDKADKHLGDPPEKFLIRIAIEKKGWLVKLWEDKEFFDKFLEYNLDRIKGKNMGVCFVSGKNIELLDFHRKYIRWSGDGSKLISSNDSNNFTYRGRFNNPSEAFGVGYEVSEKAHLALRWLIRKQAYSNNGYVVLAFGIEPGIPQPFEDSEEVYKDILAIQDSNKGISPEKVDTGGNYAKDLRMAIEGYSNNLDSQSRISIMALDSAISGKGRMAILYYREMNPGEYYNNVAYYHDSMSWEHRYKKDDEHRIMSFIGVPKTSDIIDYVFGVERNGRMTIGDNNKYKNQLLHRLLPCIIERAPIPRDFVEKSIQNAVTPLSKSKYNWNRCISVCCGLVKKHYYEKKGVELSMALNKEWDNRSYLYGRLMATAEKIERDALSKEGSGSDKRQTNAMRYMNILSKKPYSTWINVEKSIQPYLKRLPRYQREYYQKIMGEIMDLFNTEDYMINRNLEGTYVLGFHCQIQDFYRKSNTEENKQA